MVSYEAIFFIDFCVIITKKKLLMQVLQQNSQNFVLGHLDKGIDFVFTALTRHSESDLSALALRSVDILDEALTTITDLMKTRTI